MFIFTFCQQQINAAGSASIDVLTEECALLWIQGHRGVEVRVLAAACGRRSSCPCDQPLPQVRLVCRRHCQAPICHRRPTGEDMPLLHPVRPLLRFGIKHIRCFNSHGVALTLIEYISFVGGVYGHHGFCCLRFIQQSRTGNIIQLPLEGLACR